MPLTTPINNREKLRKEILDYISEHGSSSIGELVKGIRKNTNLDNFLNSEIRGLIQAMIVTGKLSYTTGLKINFSECDRYRKALETIANKDILLFASDMRRIAQKALDGK